MDAVERLEQRLAADIGRRACIAAGRGATAIWIALEALSAERPQARKVVLPATLCTSPVAVTLLAGLEPVFCDVDFLTGNLDPVALAMLLAEEAGVLCVLAAHLYGQPARVDEIARVCAEHEVFLIEDAAQAFGASVHGKPAGAFGDIAILSFGHTKIVDAGGGGAALTDHPALARTMREKASVLPPPPAELATWSAQYRQSYYRLQGDLGNQPQALLQIGELCLIHPALYRYALTADRAAAILQAIETTGDEVGRRRALSAAYDEQLAGAALTRLRTEASAAPWRYSLRLPAEKRNEVADALRKAGYDASAWYPVVARFFQAAEDWRSRWPGAVRIEEEILNLWVDNSVNEDRVRGACAVIREALEGA